MTFFGKPVSTFPDHALGGANRQRGSVKLPALAGMARFFFVVIVVATVVLIKMFLFLFLFLAFAL
jgi:hypothetical protein